jgi:hypothetical protein
VISGTIHFGPSRRWLSNNTNAPGANISGRGAGSVCKDAYNNGDIRVVRGGDNIEHPRF